MIIKEIIDNCLRLVNEESIDSYINNILRKLFEISKKDNFSKILNLKNKQIINQKGLFNKKETCVATSLYSAFFEELKGRRDEFLEEVKTTFNREHNISLCLQILSKYIGNIDIKGYSKHKSALGKRAEFVKVIRDSINQNKACVLHIQENISNTSHFVTVIGYDKNKYIYFLENGFESITLKCLSLKYALNEIIKCKSGKRCNMELIESLPDNFEKLKLTELYNIAYKYLANNENGIKQRLLFDVLLDCSEVVTVLYNTAITSVKPNYDYISERYINENFTVQDYFNGIV